MSAALKISTMKKYNIKKNVFYKKGELFINNICYRELIADRGTPLVCILLDRIKDNITIFKRILDNEYPNNRIYYALKASYLKNVLKTIKETGIGMEVISKLEMEITSRIGYKPKDVIFNGIGRSGEELYGAISRGIITNIDSFSELRKLICVNNLIKKDLKIGFRVHPDFEKDGNFVKKGSKLGMAYEETEKCIKISLENGIKVSGLSFHIFSNKLDSDDHVAAIKSVLAFMHKMANKFSIKWEYIDLGGGFAPRMFFKNDDKIKKFIKDISVILKKNPCPTKLIFELGRYVVADSAIILSGVNALKRNNGNLWAILDIGTNYLIPAPGSRFKVIPCKINKGHSMISFADGICSPAGFIDKTKISTIKEGDCVAVLNAGAYTSVMKEEFVFRSPCHIFIKNNKIIDFMKETSVQKALKNNGW